MFHAFCENVELNEMLDVYLGERRALVEQSYEDYADYPDYDLASEHAEEFLGHTLAKLDAHFVGAGYFSVVVDCPWDREKVIKIGLGRSHCGEMNDSWLGYAMFCRSEHAEGIPMLPVVHELHVSDDRFFALLDRLRPLTDDTWNSVLKDMERAMEYGMYGGDIKCPDEYSTTAYRIGEMLFEFMGQVQTDLHCSNVMQDPITGELVITDPVAGVNTGSDTLARKVREYAATGMLSASYSMRDAA